MQDALKAQRKLKLALAVGIGLAVSIGLLVGLRAPEAAEAWEPSHNAAAPASTPASERGVWQRLRGLALGAPQAELSQHRAEVRETRRAYEGAPPRIPHQVDQRNAPDCLYCHSEGLAVAGRVAPKIPHEPYLNCLQCHVVERAVGNDWVIPPVPNAPAPQSTDSSFEGARLPSPQATEFPP